MSAYTMFALMAAVFLGLVTLCVKPLGGYIADVMEGRPNFALRLGGRFESFIYRVCGVDG